MNTQHSTTTIATVKVFYTEAALIRITAKKDMPEYGIKDGETFYLSRSSANDGTYYITTFSYAATRWQCRCPSKKPCCHEKAINAALATRRQANERRLALADKSFTQAMAERENASANLRYAYGYHD